VAAGGCTSQQSGQTTAGTIPSSGMLTLHVANATVTITPNGFLRVPFVQDHFNKRKLTGSSLLAVVYQLHVVAGQRVKIARDVNRELVLVNPRGASFLSLDAGTTCNVASSAFAADNKLSAFPEQRFNVGFSGTSAVVFATPFVGGTLRLRARSGGPAVSLPKASAR
jgi:hypothetical protein